MRSKIQQLARQAAIFTDEQVKDTTSDIIKDQIFLEKLSDLIIQESVDFLSQAACDYEAEMLRSYWDES